MGKPARTGRPPTPLKSVFGPFTVESPERHAGNRRTYRVRCVCGRSYRKDISALCKAKATGAVGCSACSHWKQGKTERNAAIVAAHAGGESLGAIGRRLKLSRQRVANIIDAARKHEGDEG